jgi:uncharacterized membrane protein YfcA
MSSDIFHLFVVFFVGVAASFMSGIAGGGAGLVMAPLLIFLGVEPKTAVATTTFGAVGVSIGSLSRFRKEKDLRRSYMLPLTLIAVAAGVIGPFLLFATTGDTLKIIIGTIILCIVPLFILKKSIGRERVDVGSIRKGLGYVLYTLMLILQVAFGSGTGIGVIFILVIFFGLTMIETSATLRLPQLLSSVVSLMFYAHGQVLDYAVGAVLLPAMIIGGYLGSHVAIKSGNVAVKWIFAGLAVILAILLLSS